MATLGQPTMRRNLAPLIRYLILLMVIIAVYTVLFHVLMLWEGKYYTWFTGVYWTMTVMTTLGFGDITFESDLGRVFSTLVLMSGVLLLLIVLPFVFIRYFYAPWLEAQVRVTAPRELPESTSGHVILCGHNPLTEALIPRLELMDVPYVVLEPDAARAVELHAEGVRVMVGERDDPRTYLLARAEAARLVVANLDDATNTNLTLTVQEYAAGVPVVALAEDRNAVEILGFAGAEHVIPLKQRLGEQLAARVAAGRPGAHVIGRFRDLLIAELPVNDTPLAGKTLREAGLRERTGLNALGIWERGNLRPAGPDSVLRENSVAVFAGTQPQLASLDAQFTAPTTQRPPVVVIGGGKVGRATLRALRARGVTVHIVEQNPDLRDVLQPLADRVIIGDAARHEVIESAGILDAPSAVLTMREDASNIYLAVFCHRLNPECRVVSRIMRNRNLEAIHRAGADFVLGETALGVRSVLAVLQGRELVVVGEEVDVFLIPVPPPLVGQTLAQSGIGRETGLNVIGIESPDGTVQAPQADTALTLGTQLLALGTQEGREAFAEAYEA